MQTQKAEREKINAQFAGHTAPGRFSQRIGSTIYSVGVYFKEGSKETLNDKMYRMMQSDLRTEGRYGKMTLPQADGLPERGSV